ncbi:ABC transporter substrate-binding protein [Sinorhizobium meliloti]|uniref:ABC transporter substrate-binding protein n=1 Tax=Rhizobium meliloti TaxID=382 RepID=UPI0003DBB3A7|nr:ABC transporter substrate-binding protein [Sinorhizobium meliloti]ARS71025.1 ABC transporter substrate-binding protein [Sinorhizobium meliloti RU11/001]
MLKIQYAIICATLTTGLCAGPVNAENLIVNAYGGPYEQIIQDAVIKPFTAETGIEVIYDAIGSAAADYAKIKASRGNPGFDVAVMTSTQAVEGCKDKLLEPLTVKSVPNLAFIEPRLRDFTGDCGAVHELQYLALLYRTDKLTPAPTSWNDLASPQLNGKIVLPVFTNNMSIQLMQIYAAAAGNDPNDLDPGFKMMTKLAAQSSTLGESSALMDPMIRRGTVWAMPYQSGRSALIKAEGEPVDFIIPKEGTVPLVATLSIPSNAENKSAALKFVNYWLSKETQERWAKAYQVGSGRADLNLPDDFRAKQITTRDDIQKLILPDAAITASMMSKWSDRWEREVVPAIK